MSHGSETRPSSTSPNFRVPLDVFARLQVLRYVIVACAAVCVWDWILALADEFQMVRCIYGRRRLGYFLSGVYFILRISALGYLFSNYQLAGFTQTQLLLTLTSIVFNPVLQLSSVWADVVFNCLAFPAVALLFYVRLVAVYLHDKRAIAFFGISWIAVFAYFIYDSFCVVVRFNSKGMVVPAHVDAWAYTLSFLYDTMVYLAISRQLTTFSITGDSWRDRARSLVVGDGLPRLTKALLRSSQVYYFMTFGFGMAAIIGLYSDKVSLEYKGLMIIPNITVASVVACRLFRELRLGMIPLNNPSRAHEYGLQPLVFSDDSGHAGDLI